MPNSLVRSFVSLAALLALVSCGTEVVPAPSFSLIIRTTATAAAPAVLLESVGQLEVIIRPQPPAVFRVAELPCAPVDCGGIPCCQFENGAISTFVSATNEYVMRFDAAWVRANATVTPTGFIVTAPIYAVSTIDSPGSFDPVAFGNILRGTERIAAGTITLPWPLRGGESKDLPIQCSDGFELECMNVDPSLPLDGGP